ncbi:hypothetical protein NDU88_009360 [Pleurodeles waltl]|uniref:Uncharacterized protein n=1 Tax=Pleurodeles waltl TaxID=8319 RepID=A0AAV7RW01_PLEWA|nr:hypothetical protein NDU88_009360 [Pleurodeles waltl]
MRCSGPCRHDRALRRGAGRRGPGTTLDPRWILAAPAEEHRDTARRAPLLRTFGSGWRQRDFPTSGASNTRRTGHTLSLPQHTYARIDLFLTSLRVTNRATGTALGVASLLDHVLLMLSLAFPLHASVAKCWRLNARLLTYEDILMEIEGTIRNYLEANDAPEVWGGRPLGSLKSSRQGAIHSALLIGRLGLRWVWRPCQITSCSCCH